MSQETIRSLSPLIDAANARMLEVTIEFDQARIAANYMQQLLDLIDHHPVLIEEWELFLARAGLPKPDFT